MICWNNHRVIVMGQKGCGKMEHLRIMSGMTHEEFEKNLRDVDRILEESRKRAEIQRIITNLLWGYLRDC